MATKTISIDLEAYERLRRARRDSGESFSKVIRRAQWPEDAQTAGAFLTRSAEAPVIAEAVLRRLADLDAIRDLARRYAHCIWQKDAAGAAGLFTEDAVMDTGDRPPMIGRGAILECYSRVLEGGHFQPFVHNHVIDLDGDCATGTCYLDLRGVVDGRSMIGAGYYYDRYLRVGERWKFKSRRLNMSWLVPLSEGWAK